MTMQHVIEAAADAAFDTYAHAVALVSSPRRGPGRPSFANVAGQLDLFDINPRARAIAAEWRAIWIACERAAVSA